MPRKRNTSYTGLIHALWLALCCIPLAVLLWAIFSYGVNVPQNDDNWLMLLKIQKAFWEDSFDITQLFRRFGDHRLAFPLLIFSLFFYFIKNLKYALLLSPAITALCVLFYSAIAKISLGKHQRERRILLFTVCVLVFSLTQERFWLWAVTLSYPMANVFFLAAVFLLYRTKHTWKVILAAALLCFGASYSFLYGLLSWIALLPLLLIKKPSHNKIYVWILLFIFTLLIFFQNLITPISHSGISYSFLHPIDSLQYFFIFLGRPLSPSHQFSALILGITLITILSVTIFHILFVRKELISSCIPWICISLYGIFAGILTTIGRVARMETVMEPRRIPAANLALIGVLFILFLYLKDNKKQKIFIMFVLPLIVISNAFFSVISLEQWRARSMSFHQGKACVETHNISSSACLKKVCWNVNAVRKMIPGLGKVGFLKTFSLPKDVAYVTEPKNVYGFLDGIFEKQIMARGWAILDDCQRAKHIILTYGKDRKMFAHTTAVLPRENIASKYGKCYKYSGWEIELDHELLQMALNNAPIEVWAYDPSRNRMLKLHYGKNFALPKIQ